MKWDNVKIMVLGREVEVRSIAMDSDRPIDPTYLGSVVLEVDRQWDAILRSMPPTKQVDLTHAIFSPGNLEEPRAWLLKWAAMNGLEVVSDVQFVNDDRWIIGFAGAFPKSYPEQLVLVTYSL